MPLVCTGFVSPGDPTDLCSKLMNAYNVCFPVWPCATLAAMAGAKDVILFCSVFAILARDFLPL